jgi:hypothetical protein
MNQQQGSNCRRKGARDYSCLIEGVHCSTVPTPLAAGTEFSSSGHRILTQTASAVTGNPDPPGAMLVVATPAPITELAVT